MTIEELVQQPGRTLLRRLHPKRLEGSTWFGFSKNGIFKSILRMLHGMLKHPYPTYNDMPRNNQEIWFRTFALGSCPHTLWPCWVSQVCCIKIFRPHEHLERKVGSRRVSKRLEPRHMASLQRVLSVAGDCLYRENQLKISEKRMWWQRYDGAQCGFDELLKPYKRIENNGGVEPDFVEIIEDTHTNKKAGLIQDGYIAGLVETQLPQNDDGSSPSNVQTREKINRMVFEEIPPNRGRVIELGSLNQSTRYFYAGPSRDSDIFAELEEKDKEILVLKEQNMKILDFMRSKFSDFPNDPLEIRTTSVTRRKYIVGNHSGITLWGNRQKNIPTNFQQRSDAMPVNNIR
ncbi:hypothetical protein [Arabidopsis thaliana]|uniref:Uncharacterized protein AT4g03740 n=1 Tax=Arabidopsis thaliana TaxID=3702 RepID=Q9SY52_ARATH|nr:uncharacterized protein AT4G03740 [Arabidopsis thaliana]AAD15330.1 hypothetical protein [Arabidopsis thaliana]AEE82351.1 hypothetical protein AT4G03740 [Arabidopsis thaliana]CAB77859.1 hypothetical protein [Arabidopsis thaliana]|eukprot:NP_192283.1 hypothetical protein AT4G03740 [Arabidopsis thaliana]